MIRSKRWTELTTKGIYGKGKDRDFELCVDDGGWTAQKRRALSGEQNRASTAAERWAEEGEDEEEAEVGATAPVGQSRSNKTQHYLAASAIFHLFFLSFLSYSST